LEQEVYKDDIEQVIADCRSSGMRAVITSAPDPKDYQLTFDLVKRHAGFVYAIAGIHPEYVNRFTEQEVDDAFAVMEQNKGSLVGIGETGLDYAYIEDEPSREKQRQLFARFIRFAGKLGLPVVVHLRSGKDKETANVFEHAFEILEREGAKRVHLHMFGSRALVERAAKNGWHISMNAICMRSKSYSKVVRDTPLGRLMLETDAPWLHPSFDKEARNDPTHVREVAERVAEIKKTDVESIIEQTTKNAIEFYKL
jgi:TatD DNase family protein